ncbi:MAG: sulfotransferase family protein, partial [Vicinamibacteraceae bacterium]
ASFDAYMEACSGQKSLDVVLAARDDFIVTANHQQKIYIETSNRLTHLAPALARAFPESRFIHLHRHPYDVVRSYMKRQAYEGHPWDFARIRPRAGDADAQRWERLSSVEKLAWYWARVNRDAHDFMHTLPASRRFEVRADTLFRADAPTLTTLFAFAGVACPTKRKIQHVLAGKLNANRLPTAWDWTDVDRQRVQQLTSSVAVDLGYEL